MPGMLVNVSVRGSFPGVTSSGVYGLTNSI
jgi:hypothetical protein